MTYEDTLKLAGAEVHEYREFGSYQGDWLAKVTFEGITGWVKGSYGSCSGCDALQSELGYESHTGSKGEYHSNYDGKFVEGCEECSKFKDRCILFARPYLSEIITQEEMEKEVSKYSEWDTTAKEMVEFVKAN